jgi:hypothetical protein
MVLLITLIKYTQQDAEPQIKRAHMLLLLSQGISTHTAIDCIPLTRESHERYIITCCWQFRTIDYHLYWSEKADC